METRIEIKSHYSAVELASMALPAIPASERGIRIAAEREGWSSRRKAKGKGCEFDVNTLPEVAKAELKRRQAQSLLVSAGVTKVSAREKRLVQREEQLDLTLHTVDQLTDAQRIVAEARCALVAEVNKVAMVLGKKKATLHVADAAKTRSLPELLQQLVDRANAKGNDERTVSSRTLFRWCAMFESTTSPSERLRRLAPQQRQADLNMPWWMGEFLAAYRKPGKPPLAEAYREFLQTLPVNEDAPSEHAVRRALKKLPAPMLYQGRHTGAALAAKLPFVRRDWSQLEPGDVWVGDGHGMKCTVINPETGKPQQLEVTLGLDGASRLAVGWSISLSENVIAVSDMLRHAMTRHAPPLIYYSDNGAGETGKVLDAPLTGILPRVGIHHETGIPGNPQGRGLIERAWQTITLPLARRYATYRGGSADRDTLRLVNRDISRALTVAKNAPEGEPVAIPHVPSFAEFVTDLDAAIAEYNQRPHSSLPKRNGEHMTPAEYYEANRRPGDSALSALELQDLFRPTFLRTARRGEVQLWNNVYFSVELMAVDGQEVQVGVDIHDPASVVVRTREGRFVCLAEFDGNKTAAFAKSLRDKLLENRVKGQVKRAQDKIDLATATLRPALTMAEGDVLPGISGKDIAGAFERMPTTPEIADQEITRPVAVRMQAPDDFAVPQEPQQRIELHRQLQAQARIGTSLSERESKWLVSYAKSHEYKVLSKKTADVVQASA
ncbi:Mu transposase C-terminal domain-containing protein [Paludibacterium yongneupense]|uniref:Mu transposase C-terminal domain-containing protein n=1 Tax=Paludibacterium yongneupense TaxID=400061 RepID=UPI0003F85344|nr:Mu transposase C-terminal domain-containing protein [Paludibacterium yongneupense]